MNPLTFAFFTFSNRYSLFHIAFKVRMQLISHIVTSEYRQRERERESRFLTAHQHKTGHSVPFEVKIKAIWIIR